MAVKRGLGRGLNDLLSVSEDEAKQAKKDAKAVSKKAPAPKENEKPAPAPKKVEDESSEVMVKVTDIEPNPNQPRTNFNEDALNELAESIKRIGVIEPIVVYKKERGYEIIAGERRWRAARLAGVKEVPVIIRKYTKQQRVEIALIENIQRENLNPIEEAIAYNRLIEEFHLKQDEVADRVSKSRTTITNSLRLLKLCDKVKEMVVEQMISAGHARALITIEDPDVQYDHAYDPFDAFTKPTTNQSFLYFLEMIDDVKGTEWAAKVPHDLPIYSIAGGRLGVSVQGYYGNSSFARVRFDEQGKASYDYFWEGGQVSESGYRDGISFVFDMSRSKTCEGEQLMTAGELLEKLKN